MGGRAALGRHPGRPAGRGHLPHGGEAAALARLDAFLAGPIDDYAERRDRPADDATTRLSPYLKYGCDPRTILARLDVSKLHEKLRSELAWREFYADVLWHLPESARQSLQPKMAAMQLDEGPQADARFQAWAHGRTGFPMVDAGIAAGRRAGRLPRADRRPRR